MPEEKNSMLLGAAMLGMAAVEEKEKVKQVEQVEQVEQVVEEKEKKEGEGLKAVVCRLQGVAKVLPIT